MVINMSLGGSELAQIEKDAIDSPIANGVVIVAAVGNAGESGMDYPGAYAPGQVRGAEDKCILGCPHLQLKCVKFGEPAVVSLVGCDHSNAQPPGAHRNQCVVG